jgi:hypothetical protein
MQANKTPWTMKQVLQLAGILATACSELLLLDGII